MGNEWYEIIGNEIAMKVYDEKTKSTIVVKGTVYEGYRYQDGIVSMHGEDGKDYWCGVDSGDYMKTLKTANLRAKSDRDVTIDNVLESLRYLKEKYPETEIIIESKDEKYNFAKCRICDATIYDGADRNSIIFDAE